MRKTNGFSFQSKTFNRDGTRANCGLMNMIKREVTIMYGMRIINDRALVYPQDAIKYCRPSRGPACCRLQKGITFRPEKETTVVLVNREDRERPAFCDFPTDELKGGLSSLLG
jgi:hypothetical protein